MASCIVSVYSPPLCLFFLFCNVALTSEQLLPLVLTTWNYTDAVKQGWDTLTFKSGSPIDAVEATGHYCEMNQCRLTVGFGGSPDENGETTLDAMIMDGVTHNVGAVGGLRRIKQAISVARKVLENTDHTLLVGDQAVEFAVMMGFKQENLTTPYSQDLWQKWRDNDCQPNFRENVTPDPTTSCGPYNPNNNTLDDNTLAYIPRQQLRRLPSKQRSRQSRVRDIDADNHDTIGIIAIDENGSIASGTSTNGLTYKVPGRVGDSPVAGAGSYADSEIGAAACTGNGDIMMRFLPSYQAVSLMGTGLAPEKAAEQAIDTIMKKYPDFEGAVVAANKLGQFGASCHKWTDFQITARNDALGAVTVFNITCH